MITPLSNVFSVAFKNLTPADTNGNECTIRPAAADDIGSVLHGFKSRPTGTASGQGPGGVICTYLYL